MALSAVDGSVDAGYSLCCRSIDVDGSVERFGAVNGGFVDAGCSLCCRSIDVDGSVERFGAVDGNDMACAVDPLGVVLFCFDRRL